MPESPGPVESLCPSSLLSWLVGDIYEGHEGQRHRTPTGERAGLHGGQRGGGHALPPAPVQGRSVCAPLRAAYRRRRCGRAALTTELVGKVVSVHHCGQGGRAPGALVGKLTAALGGSPRVVARSSLEVLGTREWGEDVIVRGLRLKMGGRRALGAAGSASHRAALLSGAREVAIALPTVLEPYLHLRATGDATTGECTGPGLARRQSSSARGLFVCCLVSAAGDPASPFRQAATRK